MRWNWLRPGTKWPPPSSVLNMTPANGTRTCMTPPWLMQSVTGLSTTPIPSRSRVNPCASARAFPSNPPHGGPVYHAPGHHAPSSAVKLHFLSGVFRLLKCAKVFLPSQGGNWFYGYFCQQISYIRKIPIFPKIRSFCHFIQNTLKINENVIFLWCKQCIANCGYILLVL